MSETEGDICEPCQGSGYIRIDMGAGIVELTRDGKVDIFRGRFQATRKCVPCKGTGRLKPERSNATVHR
jgi:DnaJ-class molecular chaperone